MKIVLNGSIITEDAAEAATFTDRLAGLAGRKNIKPSRCMVFRKCGFIHCFFMKEPIDVVMTDADGRVVLVRENMKPGSVAGSVKARNTFEFGAGAARKYGIRPGDTLAAV